MKRFILALCFTLAIAVQNNVSVAKAEYPPGYYVHAYDSKTSENVVINTEVISYKVEMPEWDSECYLITTNQSIVNNDAGIARLVESKKVYSDSFILNYKYLKNRLNVANYCLYHSNHRLSTKIENYISAEKSINPANYLLYHSSLCSSSPTPRIG